MAGETSPRREVQGHVAGETSPRREVQGHKVAMHAEQKYGESLESGTSLLHDSSPGTLGGVPGFS